MQHHAEILAGKTTLDGHTQNHIKESFGVDAVGKDQMTYEALQNFILEALLESH